MKFQELTFGQIRIDGIEYGYDVVIDRGEIRERKKKPSKKFRDSFGHTPLSLEEEIPWKCRRLVQGHNTGPTLLLSWSNARGKRHCAVRLLLEASLRQGSDEGIDLGVLHRFPRLDSFSSGSRPSELTKA